MSDEHAYSHPGQPVRHSYPLAIESASISTGLELVLKTLPYSLVRFGILLALSIGSLLWLVMTFGGYLWLASSSVPLLAYPWFMGWAVVGGWGYWAVGRYFLYMLKAGHIAVLTELITKGHVDNGQRGMFEYGKDVVKERFGQMNAMFALDLLVDGVVRSFNRTLDWVARLLPIPGLEGMTRMVNAVLRASTTYVDETLLSYSLARNDENVWRSSQDGLVYYAQNAREVLKTGLWIVLLDKVLSVLIWVVCLAPGFLFSYLFPSVSLGGLLPLIAAALFASNIRQAFLKPLFLTMVMVKFHHSIQAQAIEPAWDARLTDLSDKFRTIKDRARQPAPAVVQSTTGNVAPAQ